MAVSPPVTSTVTARKTVIRVKFSRRYAVRPIASQAAANARRISSPASCRGPAAANATITASTALVPRIARSHHRGSFMSAIFPDPAEREACEHQTEDEPDARRERDTDQVPALTRFEGLEVLRQEYGAHALSQPLQRKHARDVLEPVGQVAEAQVDAGDELKDQHDRDDHGGGALAAARQARQPDSEDRRGGDAEEEHPGEGRPALRIRRQRHLERDAGDED